MNTRALSDTLARETGLSKAAAHRYVKMFVNKVTEALVDNNKVVISDFGTFRVYPRRPFNGIDPRNGEPIQVGERFVPVFRAGKALKRRLNVEDKPSTLSTDEN